MGPSRDTEQSWTFADNKQAMKRRKQAAMFSLIICSIALRANAILWCWWIQQSQLTRLSYKLAQGLSSPALHLFIFTLHYVKFFAASIMRFFFFLPSSLFFFESCPLLYINAKAAFWPFNLFFLVYLFFIF